MPLSAVLLGLVNVVEGQGPKDFEVLINPPERTGQTVLQTDAVRPSKFTSGFCWGQASSAFNAGNYPRWEHSSTAAAAAAPAAAISYAAAAATKGDTHPNASHARRGRLCAQGP